MGYESAAKKNRSKLKFLIEFELFRFITFCIGLTGGTAAIGLGLGGIQRDWELFFSLKNQSFVNFEVCILICFSYLPEEVICNKKTKINTEFEFHALKTLETVTELCIFFYGEHKS